MIEWAIANVVELLLGFLAFAISGLWGVLAKAKASFNVDMAERKKLWDEEMIRINHKFDELLGDHRDIKRDLSDLKHELGKKVEQIMVDHASHERDQAVQLEILRDLKERSRDVK